jgi:hypothetical protein
MSAKGDKPPYFARAKCNGQSEYRQTIGAAWNFKEGEGLVVKLELIPTDWDGSFILVKPKEE